MAIADIYQKATLVQIPSGYKSGTLYSVLPNTADGDFDFTRASTSTRVNKDGLIETVASGVPRLDYPLLDGVVQDCPTLLLEPQRTNLFIRSEEFDNSTWLKTRTSIIANQVVSPDGSQTADELREDTQSGGHYFYDIDYNSDAQNTFSIFAKYKGNGRGLAITFANTTYFDLENGVIESQGTDDAKMIAYPNGWYRCIITHDPASSNDPIFYLYKEVGGLSYQGDGSSGIYVWGAQAEQGSYPTSYIPTSGTTIPRPADAANGAEADFNDSEGVLYTNIAALADDGIERRITISNSSDTSELITIEYDTPSNTIHAFLFDGAFQAEFTHTLADVTTFAKVCFKYKENDFALWVNGFQIDTDNNGNVFANNTLDLLKFENSTSLNRPFYGKTKEVIAFNEALSDTELEALTSYDSFNQMANELNLTIK